MLGLLTLWLAVAAVPVLDMKPEAVGAVAHLGGGKGAGRLLHAAFCTLGEKGVMIITEGNIDIKISMKISGHRILGEINRS